MIILGVDPGIANSGLGAIECALGAVSKNEHAYKVVDYQKIITSPYFSRSEKKAGRRERPEGERFAQIADAFLGMFKRNRINAVGIEQVFFTQKNRASAMKVAQVIGMIKYLCHLQKVPSYEFRPMDVKAAVGAKGKDKSEVIACVEALTGTRFKTDHVADAVAVAITYAKYAKVQGE